VRDRYGSFRREDLARNLHRCVNDEVQIEQKTIGAGLGLYLIASESKALVINVLPDEVSEFICVLEGPSQDQELQKMISVTVQLPH
jgi:hypothetical protein